MKRLFAAAIALSALASAAEAKCTIASLNGNWLIAPAGGDALPGATGTTIAVAAGTIPFAPGTIVVKTFSAKTCVGYVELRDAMSTVIGYGTISANSIDSGSAAKPNQVKVSFSAGPITVILALTRA